jgi:predicted nucleotidyltransferase
MTKLRNVDIMELNEAYQKVLIWFFSFPQKEIGLNNLSEELRISKTTAKIIVNRLINDGFLNREVLGKIWRISCNKDHIYNYSRKISYNLTMIYESGILNSIHDIIENPRAIILFGSYRKGDDNEKSDIDIAVEVLDNEEQKIIELGTITKFGHRKNVLVNIYKFSRNKVDLNLFSNIVNGIVLEGFLEARP